MYLMFFIHLSSEATSGTIASATDEISSQLEAWYRCGLGFSLQCTRVGYSKVIDLHKKVVRFSSWASVIDILLLGKVNFAGQVSMNQHYWCQSRSNIAVIEFDGYRGQSVDVAARGGDICHVNLDPGVFEDPGVWRHQ